ncbi:MAG: elongation factor P [Planctomycetota bacterium]
MRASDIRKGQAVIIDGNLYVITEADHNTPGNLRAKVQFKMRDVRKGTIQNKRVGATDDIETANLDRRTVEYLYEDGTGYVFMDNETYEQSTIPADVIGNDIKFLKPNEQITASFLEGELVTYELPNNVELEVKECPPGIKGATVTNQTKDATMETGLVVKVPPFIEAGQLIRVSCSDGSYIERVNK